MRFRFMLLLFAGCCLPSFSLAQKNETDTDLLAEASRLTSADIPALLSAPAAGNPRAHLLLGIAYAHGYGVQQDFAEAARWFHQAADEGSAIAQASLADLYDRGLGVSKDSVEALKWWRASAERGYAAAQFSLGNFYSAGRGVPVNFAEAFRWYRKAAEQDDSAAQLRLADFYRRGLGVAFDFDAARDWLVRSARLGNAEAQRTLTALDDGQFTPENTESLELFRRFAGQGRAWAQHGLGNAHQSGQVVRLDLAEALRWFEMAAAQDYAPSQNALGFLYAKGMGVAQDDDAAVRWYRKAAGRGLSTAENNLGWALLFGRGAPRDPVEALQWFRRAVAHPFGDVNSYLALGFIYENALGVPADFAEAFFWYSLAAEERVLDKPARLDALRAKLTPQQIADVRQRITDWRLSHPPQQQP